MTSRRWGVRVVEGAGLENRSQCPTGINATPESGGSSDDGADGPAEALAPSLRTEDPQLAEVVAAWPDLEAPIRAAIVTMARKLRGQ